MKVLSLLEPFLVTIFVVTVQLSFAIPVEDDLLLTLKEKKALDQLKPLILNLLPNGHMRTDIHLIKWLRVVNLNVHRAKEMILKNLDWRDQHSMDTILQEEFTDMEQEFPALKDIKDYSGRPVMAMDASQWDIRKALVTGRRDKLRRYGLYLMEYGVQQIYDAQSRGENVTQGSTLINLQGFNLITHACSGCLVFYINFLLDYENHYPGMTHKIVIINTPATFEVVLAALRPVMSQQTKEALTIFGMNKRDWSNYILDMIPIDQLERQFGGDRNDGF